MAIVVYKCDVCKREKDYQRNVEGIEKVQRCTITHGCRGKLFQVKVLPDYIRGTAPVAVAGLDEWRQRKVLFDHKQTIARDSWNITHNLGTFPSISVFVNIPVEGDTENLVEIQPIDTIIIDDNNMKLVFDRPWSGIAQLVARQSDPDLLKPFTNITTAAATELQQISIGGEIAIATRVSSIGEDPVIGLTVSYTNTQNVVIENLYADVNEALTNSVSPWDDFNKVVIKGKIYTIRSYYGIIPAIRDDTVGPGSTFNYTGVTPSLSGSPPSTTSRTIQKDEVYVLFADSPFNTVDKDTLQYIDVADITSTQNTFALLYDSGEFFAQKDVIRSTYPPIRKI